MPSVTIHTTQNVSIDCETARIGTRIGAWLIDAVVLLVAYLVVLYTAEQFGSGFNREVALRLGPIFWAVLYFFVSEWLGSGRTVGKRLLHLRVIRLDGEELTPADHLTRALFLLPDVLFTAGTLALLFITTGGRSQRLGDIVARTVVIQDDPAADLSLADVLTIRNREQHRARYPAVQRLAEADMLTVQECLLRYRRYRNAAHREAVQLAGARLAGLLGIDPEEAAADAEQFLETLLLDYIVLTR
ncbi:RDD family protein [Neolewinella litorea]|uniref:RDD family protein n=1 Tax=Neolewinella litorea TaxID=2562452 RepID=A0A4S4NBV7_9BACT|nr:RDD family protein [Neolewinella litorea]THH35518.1 RDD family protein [Neolewinella litorea]